jgi:hypothetical protein
VHAGYPLAVRERWRRLCHHEAAPGGASTGAGRRRGSGQAWRRPEAPRCYPIAHRRRRSVMRYTGISTRELYAARRRTSAGQANGAATP